MVKAKKPKYGFYAVKIIISLFLLIETSGIILYVLSRIFPNIFLALCGLIVVIFGLYIIIAYILSAYIFGINYENLSNLWINIIQIKGDEYTLDVGCGTGRLTIQIAKKLTTGKVIGLDIWDKFELSGNSPDKLNYNAIMEGVADIVEPKSGNVLKIPFNESIFDLITCASVINNLKGEKLRIQSLKEIYRVLKPGKKLVLIEPLRSFRNFLLFTPFGYPQLGKRMDWEQFAEKAGFIIIKYLKEYGIGIFILKKRD